MSPERVGIGRKGARVKRLSCPRQADDGCGSSKVSPRRARYSAVVGFADDRGSAGTANVE
jgi:hypothetical protein